MVISRSFRAPVLLLSCLLALAAAPLRADDIEELQKRFTEANAKVDAGDNQAALEIYNQILEVKPEADNVWVTRAIAKWRLKDQSGAFADLAQAIRVNPESFEAYNWRARFRYDKKDYQRSLPDLNRAIELAESMIEDLKDSNEQVARDQGEFLDAQQADLLRYRAETQANLGDRAAAFRDLSRAIDLRPDFAAALFLRGRMYDEDQEIEPAIADYSRVVQLTPKNAEAWSNLGWLQFTQHNWDEAIADAEKALQLTPDHAQTRRTLGFAQFAKADYQVAAETLAKAASAEPGMTAAYALFVRHYALLRSGGADTRLVTTWETWEGGSWIQAIAKFIIGQISEEELEKAAQDTPDDGELMGRACEMHFYIGLARAQAGDKSTARLRFKSALGTEQKDFVEDALAAAELKRL